MQYDLKREVTGKLKLSLTMEFNSLEDAMKTLHAIENGGGTAVLTPMEVELLPMIKSGQMLQAVKHYKEKSGEPLRESKDYCDNLRLKFKQLNLID